MGKFRRVVLTLLCAVVAASFAVTLASCDDNSATVSAKYDGELFWRAPAFSDVVYAISAGDMTVQETEMIVSLQGIVAKTSSSVFIDTGTATARWLEYSSAKYGFAVQRVDDPWELVSAFSDHIADGRYVLYNSHANGATAPHDCSANHATTVAGAEKWLMVPTELEDQAKAAGLTLGRDVRSLDLGTLFEEYKDRLNRHLIVHQAPFKWQLRDYSVAAGALCCYGDYEENEALNEAILDWAEPNIPVMGWTENETAFVRKNSRHAKITIAADWSENLSLYSAFPKVGAATFSNYDPPAPERENKHYVAIVMSDGDNLQWMQNDFVFNERYFGSERRGDFPVTWTIAPGMADVAPHLLDYLYENGTALDQFIAGPSGAGYINAAFYDKDNIAGFASITAEYMRRIGVDYVNLIDTVLNPFALRYYAAQDAVKGGVWSVGNKYVEGRGGVFWANDKPFVCMRDTLWLTDGDDPDNARYGSVETVAERINGYPVDPSAISGYTVVIAHAWSVGSMDDIARFVAALDEDVELVTVGQLLELVSENVPHIDMPCMV